MTSQTVCFIASNGTALIHLTIALLKVLCVSPLLYIISFSHFDYQDDEEGGSANDEDPVARAEEDFFAMINADRKKREQQKAKQVAEDESNSEKKVHPPFFSKLIKKKPAQRNMCGIYLPHYVPLTVVAF